MFLTIFVLGIVTSTTGISTEELSQIVGIWNQLGWKHVSISGVNKYCHFQLLKLSQDLQIGLVQNGTIGNTPATLFCVKSIEVTYEPKHAFTTMLINPRNCPHIFNATRKRIGYYTYDSHSDKLTKVISNPVGHPVTLIVERTQVNSDSVDFDFQGSDVKTISLTYEPFLKMTGCKSQFRECHGFGFTFDLMEILAKRFNFTWSLDKQADGNWGSIPDNGEKFLHSLQTVLRH